MAEKSLQEDTFPESRLDLDLHQHAKEKALANEALTKKTLTLVGAQQLLHELRVHQIELELQNEELRRAHAELEASRARYVDLYDLAPTGYVTLSEKGLILEANLTFAGLLGKERGALVKQPLTRFILPEDQDIYYQLCRQLLATDDRQACELRMLRPDASPFWARLEANAAKTADGATVSHTIVMDITLRKQAEEALRESEERYRMVADYTYNWEYWLAPDGRLLYVSPSCERITGYRAEEFMQDPGLLVRITHPDDQDQVASHLGHAFDHCGATKDADRHELDFRILTRSGEERWIAHACQHVFGHGHTYLGRRASNRDITNRRQLENQLSQAQKMEAIGTLAGGIAHDFNNLLAVILGYADIAMDSILAGTELQDSLQKISDAGNKAKDLVRQILAFSRQMEMKRIPFQPVPLVKEAIKFLRSTIPTTITIRQNIDPQCGVIMADTTQFYQVLVNLCTNAYQAMEAKGGVLGITLANDVLGPEDLATEPEMRPGRYVRLTVQDNGMGIDPLIRKRIFDPYFTTKEVGKGTGLGLAVVLGIVKSHGGLIRLESQAGKGSAFHVYFPVIEEPAVAAEKRDGPLPGGKERILFVDDEDSLAEMSMHMLQRLGYTVTMKRDGIKTLETFAANPDGFDLVITDMTMPGMTGVELARLLHNIRPDLPIILSTGHSNLIDAEQALAMGFVGFAMKPVTRAKMAKLIREVLDGR